MNIYMNGKDLMVENANNEFVLGGNFRNFGGLERKDKRGQIVNAAGNRNFNLRIPDEALSLFVEHNCRIKEYGGNQEEGEAPIHFVKVNIKIDSKTPPRIMMVKSNGKLKTLRPDMYSQIDGMFIETADLVLNFYRRDYNDPNCQSTLYLNYLVVKQKIDPITAKWDGMMEEDDLDPNIPDVNEEAIPF